MSKIRGDFFILRARAVIFCNFAASKLYSNHFYVKYSQYFILYIFALFIYLILSFFLIISMFQFISNKKFYNIEPKINDNKRFPRIDNSIFCLKR